MNAPGEIAPLAALARPHVAMVTTVEAVHLAAFRDLAGIAREKAAIFSGLEPGGAAILNRDTPTYPILLAAARRAGARLLRFGRTGRPEYRLGEVKLGDAGTSAAATARGRSFLFRLGAPGRHLAMNALGVLAAVEALGGDVGVAAVALGRWQPPEGRGVRWTVLIGPGGLDGAVSVIDESYNANPAAMAAAFEVFAAAQPTDGPGRISRGRRVAFLGDMLELGPRRAGAARRPRRGAGAGAALDRPLRRHPDARAARGAAGGAARRMVPRAPRRWPAGRRASSTPATSRWPRARAAPGSTSSSRRSSAWARRGPPAAPKDRPHGCSTTSPSCRRTSAASTSSATSPSGPAAPSSPRCSSASSSAGR